MFKNVLDKVDVEINTALLSIMNIHQNYSTTSFNFLSVYFISNLSCVIRIATLKKNFDDLFGKSTFELPIKR